jgi:phosphate transport system ATP-binding protein
MAHDAALEYSIRTQGLNLWYGDFHALKDIDIQLRQACVTALIGPSGCGKTSLLRCFNRINERYGNVKTTGAISILGKNIYDPDVSLSELRKTVGMVFQRPNPLPISIYENVLFGLRVHTERNTFRREQRDALVQSALEDVFLWKDVREKLHSKATLLTLEQQQKLCIARLLPLKPRVILMDEPCSALDAEGTLAIETLIDSLKGKYTMVVVTHNMGQAARASEECIYMLLGQVIEHGKTQDIFLRPQRKETEMYIEGRYG